MLRNCLTSQAQLMLHCHSRAQFEQGLAVALHQFVKYRPTNRRNDRLEDVAHWSNNRQVLTCLSRPGTYGRPSAAEVGASSRKCRDGLVKIVVPPAETC